MFKHGIAAPPRLHTSTDEYRHPGCKACKQAGAGGTFVVVMRPCRRTSVTSPRTNAFRWSAGRLSFFTRFWWRMANTRAPFCGKLRILLAAPAAHQG